MGHVLAYPAAALEVGTVPDPAPCRLRPRLRPALLTDLAPGDPGLRKAAGREGALIASAIAGGLHSLYVTPAETREAGYILTEHFGRKLNDRGSRIDLDRISQRWLRDLVRDHFADVLRSPSCPRSGSTFDHTRRAAWN